MGNRDDIPGVGIAIPPRQSDCTGQHPSWYPFQLQVDQCDVDVDISVPLTARHFGIGEPQGIRWEPDD